MKKNSELNFYNFQSILIKIITEIRQKPVKALSALALGMVLITSGCQTGSLNPNTSIPAVTTPSEDPTLAPTPSPTIEPAVLLTPSLSPDPTMTPSPTDNNDIGIDKWKDKDSVNAKAVLVPYFTIDKKPYKLFAESALVNGPKGEIKDGLICAYTNAELFYIEVVNGSVKLIPTEFMKRLIEERFPGGEFESQGYDALGVYLVNEKSMTHDEAEAFMSEIKIYEDLRTVNADPNIIPVGERFIIFGKDIKPVSPDVKAEIADMNKVLELYREQHGMRV